MAYTHLFFFFAVILTHTLTPIFWNALAIYAYVVSEWVNMVAIKRDRKMTSRIVFYIQTFALFFLYGSLLVDDWCRFFLYRGHA